MTGIQDVSQGWRERSADGKKIQWKSVRHRRITIHNRRERKSETIWVRKQQEISPLSCHSWRFMFFLRIPALLKIKVPFIF